MLIAVKLSGDVRKQIRSCFNSCYVGCDFKLGMFICCGQQAEYSLVQCNYIYKKKTWWFNCRCWVQTRKKGTKVEHGIGKIRGVEDFLGVIVSLESIVINRHLGNGSGNG